MKNFSNRERILDVLVRRILADKGMGLMVDDYFVDAGKGRIRVYDMMDGAFRANAHYEVALIQAKVMLTDILDAVDWEMLAYDAFTHWLATEPSLTEEFCQRPERAALSLQHALARWRVDPAYVEYRDRDLP